MNEQAHKSAESLKQQITAIVPSLRRFAYSLTGNAADADDLLQNTVEKLLTKELPDDVDLLKWSFRVCRNLWIDEFRAAKVRQKATEAPEHQEAQVVDGEQVIYQSLTVREVVEQVNTLPEDQRSALALVAIEGMSYKEAADALSIPIGTVMSRMARARQSMSDWLNRHGTGALA